MLKTHKVNLLKDRITVNKKELLHAIESKKQFGITLSGDLRYFPFDKKEIFIYQGQLSASSSASATKPQDFLGENYEVTPKEETFLINAAKAWQDIITYNVPYCHYHDTCENGLTEFLDETLENMGWMIIDFDVTYKEMLEFLEKNVSTTLLYIQSDEPYYFNSIGYFDDIKTTTEIFFTYCQEKIQDKLANDPDYTYDYLDEDQQEAVAYFKAK